MGFYVKPCYIQAYPRDIPNLVPDHHNKANCNLFAGRESRLQFVKNSALVKCNKAKCKQTGPVLVSNFQMFSPLFGE